MKRLVLAKHGITLIAECWTLAEIYYYYTHDGETLHSVAFEMLHNLADRLTYRRTVRETLEMIQDLPETGQ